MSRPERPRCGYCGEPLTGYRETLPRTTIVVCLDCRTLHDRVAWGRVEPPLNDPANRLKRP